MGKSGKQRKRLRLLRQQTALESIPGSADAKSDGSGSEDDTNPAPTNIVNGASTTKIINESDMAATLRTLHTLSEDMALFRSPSMKILRTAIQPLVEEQIKRSKVSKDGPVGSNLSGKKRTKDPGPPIAEIHDSEESATKLRFGSKVAISPCVTDVSIERMRQVCDALRDKRWGDALTALEGMRRQREVRFTKHRAART